MPKLSAEKRKDLQKLAAKPDREIDLTDIPEIREIPPDAVIGRFYRPKKSTGNYSARFRCPGVAEGNWRRIPDTHQCLFA